MPAEWQARQLLLTTSAPGPLKLRSPLGMSTWTDRSVTPSTLTEDGACSGCAAAAAGRAPPRPRGRMARRITPAAIAAPCVRASNDRFMDLRLFFLRQATASCTLSTTLRMKPPPYQFGSIGCASPLALVQRAFSVSAPDDGARTSALHGESHTCPRR